MAVSTAADGRVEIQLNSLSEPDSDNGTSSDRAKRPGRRSGSESRCYRLWVFITSWPMNTGTTVQTAYRQL